MSIINISLERATVTNIKEFCSHMGYGIDIHVEVKDTAGTVYFQIVLYDDRARKGYASIHVGDSLQVSGPLKVKNYKKSDGTIGLSLVMEKPGPINILPSRSTEPQLLQPSEENNKYVSLQQPSEEDDNSISKDKSLVSIPDTIPEKYRYYYEKYNDVSEIEDPWMFDDEEFEEIVRLIKIRKSI